MSKHSPSVVNGIVQRTSASALKTADPWQGGCFRKWWYAYVLGLREPDTEATLIGKKAHKEIQNYYQKGDRAMGSIAMHAWRWMVPRHPAIEAEYKITPQHCFEVGGLPVAGEIDLINASGIWIDPMGVTQESDIIEVVDWKSTSDTKYAKNGSALLADYQMTLYGMFLMGHYDRDQVRLSHTYMPTKRGKPLKTTVVATVEKLQPTWERAEKMARMLPGLAAITDVNLIEPNLKSCDMYKGCPHAAYCPKSNAQVAEHVFGKATTMTMLPPPPTAPIPAQADNAVQLRIQQLKGQEAAAQSATLPPPAAPPRIDPEFVAALTYIQVNDMGRPGLIGRAAEMQAAALSQLCPEGGYGGTGPAGGLSIEDPAQVVQLAREVEGHPGKPPFNPPAHVLPMDAPVSNPALAALPVDGAPANVPQPPPIQAPVPAPAPAPVSTPPAPVAQAPAAPAPTPAPQAAPAPAPVAGDKMPNFQKMRKPDLVKECETMWPITQGAAPAFTDGNASKQALSDAYQRGQEDGFKEAAAKGAAPAETAGLSITVNCVDPGATDLATWIDGIAATICKQYGAVDLRCAPNDGPLGFGRWKGALAAMVRDNPPADGHYTIDTRGSEIYEVAADALRPFVTARGF